MKLLLNEIKDELAKCNLSIDYELINTTPFVCIHHIHDWDHGYDGHTGFQGTRREFYKDMGEISAFLFDYINFYAISYFIVAPFHKNRQFDVVDKDCYIYKEIRNYLRTYKIRNDSQSGVKLPVRDNQNVIEMVLEGAFVGVSALSILFPERKILLSPHHHLNISFYIQEFDKEQKSIKELLKGHSNLRYYERRKGFGFNSI